MTDDAVALELFGHQSKTGINAGAGGRGDGCAVHLDGTVIRPVHTRDEAHKLGPARPDKARNPQDLARLQLGPGFCTALPRDRPLTFRFVLAVANEWASSRPTISSMTSSTGWPGLVPEQ